MQMVRSAGVEPTLSAPEANVLSTGLRAHNQNTHIILQKILFVERFFFARFRGVRMGLCGRNGSEIMTNHTDFIANKECHRTFYYAVPEKGF